MIYILSTLPLKTRRWFITGGIALSLSLLLAAGIFYDNTRNPRSIFARFLGTQDPVYQWVESDSRSFDFMAGEGKAWGPVEPQQGEIRYAVKAAMPVDTGLMDTKWSERMDAWGFMRQQSRCFEGRIQKSSKTCRMTNGKPQLIFVRDLRTKQAGVGSLSSFGTKGKLEPANSVTVTILSRKCVENCNYALK